MNIDYSKITDNPEVIKLLKQRIDIENKIKSIDETALIMCELELLSLQNVVCRYYHPLVGYGDFVKEYNGRYGVGLIIRLDNGREWFAPINEFTRVR